LTNTAAIELADGLAIGREHAGTLHHHANRELIGSYTGIAETGKYINQWNEEHPDLALSGGERDTDEDNASPYDGRMIGDDACNAMNCMRARLIKRELWPESVTRFHKAWCQWKKDNDLIDFTDMLELALENQVVPPGNPDVIFADEAQDFSALEMALLQKWGRKAGRLVVVGDPWQCQPGETLVRTATGGLVRMDQLDPAIHRLVSYDRHAGRFVGRQDGYAFQKTSRQFNGRMITIAVNGKETRCTPNHKWLARWKDTDTDHCVVYMMRKGDRFRIGWCQLFTKGDGSFHFGQRARLEKADDAWILKSFDSRAEASRYESIVAITYGLPLITFEPKPSVNGHTTRDDIETVFNALNAKQQYDRAFGCLNNHGRDLRFPLWSAKQRCAKQGKRTPHELYACNLIPELMTLPVESKDGKQVTWHPFKMKSKFASEEVFSLNIEPYHNYVADGILTLNCLYEWRGSSPDVFFSGAAKDERVLGQSYRVPRAVHAAAMRWIEKMPGYAPIEYHPTEAEGEVASLSATYKQFDAGIELVEDAIGNGKSVMILATCAYMLHDIIKPLRAAGIPFKNDYRRKNGGWNPLLRRGKSVSSTDRLLAFMHMADEGFWTRQDLMTWLSGASCSAILPGKQSFKKFEPILQNLNDGEIPYGLVETLLGADTVEHGLSGALDWYVDTLNSTRREAATYPCRIVERRGTSTLRDAPQVTIGTVHSVKGGESDAVIIAPDLSQRGVETWSSGLEGKASIYRLMYVALTRARESVHIMNPVNPQTAVRLI
jgi:hypothetical protein